MERWVPVPGWEGFYEVSDLGRVRSVDREVVSKLGVRRKFLGQLTAQPLGARGYPRVKLCRTGEGRDFYVHRLVMLAFVGPCPLGLEVCHNNGVKTDCRLTNLRYDTPKGNAADRVGHGTAGFGSRLHQTRCKRGHLLEAPNLRKAQGRKRCCASCQVAYFRLDSPRSEEQWQRLADEAYVSLGFELGPAEVA